MDLKDFVELDEHPGYFVDPQGGVYHFRRLSQFALSGKYTSVGIDSKPRLVGRLVARAFLPQPDFPDPIVTYRDGNMDNCAADNLIWVSRPSAAGKRKFRDFWPIVRYIIDHHPGIQLIDDGLLDKYAEVVEHDHYAPSDSSPEVQPPPEPDEVRPSPRRRGRRDRAGEDSLSGISRYLLAGGR
jgi:hypothetical protein